MALTSIGQQKTPGRPIELTFAAELGLPSDAQELLLIGHKDAVSGSIAAYTPTTISNSGDEIAASGEVDAKFGAGSELAKMVLAAIRANAGVGTNPTIKCIPLDAADAGFGSTDQALLAARKVKAEYIVSCYDGTDDALRTKIKDHCVLVSGPQRVENNQFGTIGVVFNRSVQDPSTLPMPDSLFIAAFWLPDSGAPAYSVGESAAAIAARMAANNAPFNPLDDVSIGGIAAPALETDWPTRGAGLESEACLNRGWSPLWVKPNAEVAFVRTVTSRLSPDGTGSPLVTAYYDVQDFNVLFFWRRTLYTRFSQPDFKRRKNSTQTKQLVLSELIRLAQLFQSNGMFQAVDTLAKKFQVEQNASDRHRTDYKTPVNVIPGLHVLAGNIEATTEGDVLTVTI